MKEGSILPEFHDSHLMDVTGWSYETLQETPADVVRQYEMYLIIKNVVVNGGKLPFGYVAEEGKPDGE